MSWSASSSPEPTPRPPFVARIVGGPRAVLRVRRESAARYVAVLSFRYPSAGGTSHDAEQRLRTRLYDAGFTPCLLMSPSPSATGPEEAFTFADITDWVRFVDHGAAALIATGAFEIVFDPTFDLVVLDSKALYTDLEPEDGDDEEASWFSIDFGIRVGDERVSLLPILVEVIGRCGPPKDDFVVSLADRRFVTIPRARIEPLVDVVYDLASRPSGERRALAGAPRISRAQALGVVATTDPSRPSSRRLAEQRSRLAKPASLPPPRVPSWFTVELRAYQREAVSWLTALYDSGCGAVLADDMGLGKTITLLAFLSSLRRAKPDRPPTLVVAPTSVVASWTVELERVTPNLDVVLWHGSKRRREAWRLDGAHVVLTSYALLHRDVAELGKREWDVIVLDEAQAIKNGRTVFSDAARALTARQRIAVTGTPIENHLGELHSIVSFAVPGLLGNERAFTASFREPIEKFGDRSRLEALRHRIEPVLLRRTKEEVATELPPKTFIVQPIELADDQRDLYEAVRSTVAKQVREEIERRGLLRSKLTVLDALLKLRQVCCDPRLLKLKGASDAPPSSRSTKKQVTSAKREAFRELLTGLCRPSRSVLVFSQFVEMLSLLGNDLEDLGLSYAMLTGSTVDRAAQIDRFRRGDARVFLISLKAGGTGLTLIEADTVIHYDPWWNPAAEAQATDRAHRIGQKKPVFVHRLIAKNTVEDRIVALQTRKAELARGLLSGEPSDSVLSSLDENAVQDLFAE
ncbi:MAG: DEAD/DEAH box helicase [Polyangiaceae bacterium]